MSTPSNCPPNELVFDRFHDFPDSIPLTDEQWTDLWETLCITYQNWVEVNVEPAEDDV